MDGHPFKLATTNKHRSCYSSQQSNIDTNQTSGGTTRRRINFLQLLIHSK